MTETDSLRADMTRVAKLKELAGLGKIDGPSSYFNHLIDVYGDLGKMGTSRVFSGRERERIDLFLASFVNEGYSFAV